MLSYSPRLFKNIVIGIIFSFTLLFAGQKANASVLPPGNIDTCGELATAETYTLTSDIDVGSSTPCFIISASDVYINPDGHILTGNITLKDNGSGDSPFWYGDDSTWRGQRTWTFNDYSGSEATTTGYAVFNDNSAFSWNATHNGNLKWNSLSGNVGGKINGDLFFGNSDYYSSGSTLASATGGIITISSRVGYSWYSNVSGTIYGSDNIPVRSFIFSGNAINYGTINATATFNESSSNEGTINGNADVYYPAHNPLGGTVTGTITYHTPNTFKGTNSHDWADPTNWSAGVVPTSTDDVAVEAGISSVSSGTASVHNIIFKNSWLISTSINVGGTATFYGSNCYTDAGAVINGNVIFNDYCYNNDGSGATINGNVTFYDGSFNRGNINGTATFYGGTENSPSYGQGNINGTSTFNGNSSNLGNIYGNAYFNDYGNNLNNSGGIYGNAYFNGSRINAGYVAGDAYYNSSYYNNTDNSMVGGVVTLSNGWSWTGQVDGKIYGPDNVVVNRFVFNGNSFLETGVASGTVIFNGDSYNNAEARGTTTFNGNSYNNGTVTGDAIFNTTYYNNGTTTAVGGVFTVSGSQAMQSYVNGNSYGSDHQLITSYVFKDSSVNYSELHTEVNFYNESYNWGSVFATTTFNDNSYNYGYIEGSAIFNNSSYNNSTVTGSAVFKDSSSNNDTINGNADVYYPVSKPLGGNVTGVITYHGYPGFYYNNAGGNGDWNNINSWWSDESFLTPAPSIPGIADDAFIYADLEQNTGDPASVSSIIFYDTAQNFIGITTTSHGAFFNASSSNHAHITGPVHFNNGSTNSGTITGPAVFNGDGSENIYTYNQQPVPMVSVGQTAWVSMASSADGTKIAAIGGRDIYTSSDSGAHWTQQTNAGNRQWQAITSSADGTKIVAIVYSGYIYTSSDSGETWTEQTNAGNRQWQAITSSADGTKLAAVNGNNGYIYTSSDSGVSWTQQTGAGQHYWYSITSSADGTKLAVIANYSGYIYTSSDSGATWTAQTNAGQRQWHSITLSADGTKLAAGEIYNGYTYTSSDSGVNWTQQTDAGQHLWYSITSSADGKKLAAIVQNGYVYTSKDFGVNWTPQVDAGQHLWYSVTSSADGSKIFAGVFGGYIYSIYPHDENQAFYNSSDWVKQTGSGQHLWNSITSSADGTKLAAVNGNYGYIYTSSDSGVHWTQQTSAGQHYWYSITSSADGTKLAAVDSNYGYIYTSSDSGVNWIQQTDAGQHSWYSITSSADGTKLAAYNSNEGYVHTSSDSGVHWTKQTSSGRHWFSSLTSSSDGTKLVGDVQNGYIYTSSDSGVHWTQQTGSGQHYWNSITSSADGTKLAAADYDNGYIYTSSDSGVNWIQQTDAGQHYWYSITSSADGTKLAAVDINYGYIYTSSDSGVHWTVQTGAGKHGWNLITSSADGTKLAAVDNGGYIYTSNITDSNSPIREYVTDTNVGNRDFTNTGTNWIIQAVSSVVDLSSAIYDTTMNFFQALLGGSFITNPNINGGAAIVPTITITQPSTTTVITKWLPSINWGNSSVCEYSYDNFTNDTNAVTCSNHGSDIPKPSNGAHTIYLKGINASSSLTTKAVSFTYNNTVPTYTTCGTDLLDESSRPYYYLQGNVTGNCIATVSTELRGAQSTTTIAYSVNGNIIATSTVGGLNITLKNIRVTGDVYSSGYTNTDGTGYNGGTITISTSTTGSIYSNGGDGTINGGNGGVISITNSYGISNTTGIQANGGAATICGSGGDGGSITLTRSTYSGTKTNAGGLAGNNPDADHCNTPNPTHSGGHTPTPVVITGTYTPPSSGGNNNTGGDTSQTPVRSSSGQRFTPGIVNTLTLPVNLLKPIKLTDLPSFGGNKGFNFTNLDSFIHQPLPQSASAILGASPSLKDFLNSLGLRYANDLVSLQSRPIDIPATTTVPGIFIVTKASTTIPSFVIADKKYTMMQRVTVTPDTTLTITLKPLKAVTNTSYFGNKAITFKNNTVTITASSTPGRYILTSTASAFPLAVDVVVPQPPPAPPVPQTVWSRVWSWFTGWLH